MLAIIKFRRWFVRVWRWQHPTILERRFVAEPEACRTFVELVGNLVVGYGTADDTSDYLLRDWLNRRLFEKVYCIFEVELLSWLRLHSSGLTRGSSFFKLIE
jgi:hypothetical protein